MNRVPREANDELAMIRPCFPTFTVIGVMGLVILVGASWAWNRHKEIAQTAPATVESEVSQPATEDGASSTAQTTVSGPIARTRVTTAQAERQSIQSVAGGAGSVAAEQLIGQLAQLQIADGKLTSEQGQQIQRRLQQLVAQGAAAVPAIRAFLDKDQDLPFGADGSKAAGVPSLRAGLIDSLRQIGGPESLALSHEILQSSADPLEIALLARNLEEGAPGQYRQEALDSARQSLALAAQGKLGDRDVGPIFQVLQTYGDANTAAELAKLAPQWSYYATIALAAMPSGTGIASLIDLAHQPPSAETGQYNKLPYQMLAQLSSEYSQAGSALLDMAQQNQIPDSAWRAVAAGLGGNQYQFTRQLPQDALPSGATMETGSTIVGGPPQTFYSLPIASGTDLAQRLAIIDQLLSVVSGNPAAIDALNQARAKLSASVAAK